MGLWKRGIYKPRGLDLLMRVDHVEVVISTILV
jgi:hypothetical protein